jgi:sirohydrochlorin cobaltochelatase
MIRISLMFVAAVTLCTPAFAQRGERPPMGHAHMMAPDDIQVLRERVPSYHDLSDDQINQGMAYMPPDWTWYASADAVKDKVGVLVVAHGSGTSGDKVLQDGIAAVAATHPTAIGFGMAMMGSGHIQRAVDDLVAAGAETVVVVPAVVTEQSSVFRQWAYMFGRRDDAAYLNVPRIKTTANVAFAPAMDEHPVITELLFDHTKEISKDPAKETVILLGHGPTFDHENAIELAHIATHAMRIRVMGKFADHKGLTLQDDAPAPIRAANVAKLRGWVEEANAAGRTPLIVGYLISTRGIQEKIEKDLAGLSYQFQSKGMSAHPNFTKWVRQSVTEQIASLSK